MRERATLFTSFLFKCYFLKTLIALENNRLIKQVSLFSSRCFTVRSLFHVNFCSIIFIDNGFI